MEANNPSKSTAKSDQHSNVWECHICLQLPTDPVATACGHIFCWSCIYQWLRNGPQPCPVCRTHLNKDRSIHPLYGGGARAAGPAHGNGNNGDGNGNGDGNNNGDGDGNDDGDGSAVETAASGNVIPPRPRNALLFGAGVTARLGDGSAVETAASGNDVIPPRPRNALLFGAGVTARLGDGSAVETAASARLGGSESTHEAAGDSQSSLRDLVLEILQERAALELSVNDLERRNCDLRLEAQESAVRHLRETIKLVQYIGRLRRQIVRKDDMLYRANCLLPPGWSDGIL